MQRSEIYRHAPIAVSAEVGQLLYVLARSRRNPAIVEFGCSLGVSTLYLACAILDGGGGSLMTTELDLEKAAEAQRNIEQAGVGEVVEIRVGDALRTLSELSEPIDLLFLDGWNEQYLPVLQLLEPLLVPDGLLIADLSAGDPALAPFLDHIRDPEGGWTSTTLPLDAGVELSVRQRG